MGDTLNANPNVAQIIQGQAPGFWETLQRGLAGSKGIMGGIGGALADQAMIARGGDPLSIQLRAAQQFEKMGMGATPPPIPTLGPGTEFSIPDPGASQFGDTPLPMQVGPPKFNPSNLSPAMQMVASGVFPNFFDPTKLLAQEESRAGIEQKRTAQRVSEAQIPNIEAETAARTATTAETQRQIAANKAFREKIAAVKEANPGISNRDLAVHAGNIGIELGASNDATKPYYDGLTTLDQINFHNETIKFRNESLVLERQNMARLAADSARAAANAERTLDRSDINDTRLIVNNQIQGLDHSMKTVNDQLKAIDARIKANQSIAADVGIVNKELKAAATAQIRQDQETRPSLIQEIGVYKANKAEAEKRMAKLATLTKAGKHLIPTTIPEGPPSPPSSGGPAGGSRTVPGARPTTLEEYRRLRGG